MASLKRAYIVELVGSFGLVFFSAGVVCMNYLAQPADQPPGAGPLFQNQAGLVGIALAQGFIYAVLLSLSLPVSGGYLNPAISLMLWAFNRLDTKRASWLIGAQIVGAFLAGAALRFTFDREVLAIAHFGTPHLNPLAYQEVRQASLYGGMGLELVLTFFLVFAIFGAQRAAQEGNMAAWMGGAVVAAAVLVGFPVTGAALNPARWLGTVIWESSLKEASISPFGDMLIYIAGPILGALLAGSFCFFVYWPGRTEKNEPAGSGKPKKL